MYGSVYNLSGSDHRPGQGVDAMFRLTDVSFQYGDSEKGALHDVSLAVQNGECILLCGESGCGKTTITRLLNGLIPHYYEGKLSGEILVDGLDVKNEELYNIAKKVGSVFQNPRSQFFCLDTGSEVAFGCENMGLPAAEIESRVENAVSELDIKPLMGRNLMQLSGGEKQKVACASVSAMRPDIMVLDEPTSNLDMDAIRKLQETVALWKKQGKTIVISEHRLYWLKDICDRAIYLKDGKIELDMAMKEFAALSDEKLQNMGLRRMSMSGISLQEAIAEKPERIGLKNYHYSYGKKDALELDDMQLPADGIIAVTGHNGAGKSTFMRCMCGLEKKFKGKTMINGDVYNSKRMLKKCYMVMQDVNHQLFCETVGDEIELGMNEKLADRMPGLLRELDLERLADRHPMSLSGGQKQRVAIASSILADKSILIFDEPTSGLDYRHMKQTAVMFGKLRERGKTVLVITHDPELIGECCTHILHIEHGRVEEFYPLDGNHREQFLRQFLY